MPRFDPDCQLCPRLADYLKEARRNFPEYHARPVSPFGSTRPDLLIVGLGPGFHGANATGRPFTGDYAGVLLYRTLHQFGYASRPESLNRRDGLKLHNCRITNAVKCVPPGNKPDTSEINNCNRYLKTEISRLEPGAIILALGRIAHNAVLKAYSLKQAQHPFAHGQQHALPDGCWLLDSYHCSRYNTQTRRLTEKMFQDIFYKIDELISISN